MIGKVLKHFQQQRVDCVLVIPAINSPSLNLVSSYITDLLEISGPFDHKASSVLNGEGKRTPKKNPHTMISALSNLFFSFTPFIQIDEQIQRMDDETFIWLINHNANPQGGLELFDRNTLI